MFVFQDTSLVTCVIEAQTKQKSSPIVRSLMRLPQWEQNQFIRWTGVISGHCWKRNWQPSTLTPTSGKFTQLHFCFFHTVWAVEQVFKLNMFCFLFLFLPLAGNSLVSVTRQEAQEMRHLLIKSWGNSKLLEWVPGQMSTMWKSMSLVPPITESCSVVTLWKQLRAIWHTVQLKQCRLVLNGDECWQSTDKKAPGN